MSQSIYPMMPLRDIVLFPHMVAPLVVGRQKSIKALEKAMADGTEIFLTTQKDSAIDDPGEKNVYSMGTIATVLQLLRLPDGTIKALVEGKRRGRVTEFIVKKDFMMVDVEEFDQDVEPTAETIAYIREVLNSFKKYARLNKKISSEVFHTMKAIIDLIKIQKEGGFHAKP